MEESAVARERWGGKERESDRDVRNVEEGRGRGGGDGEVGGRGMRVVEGGREMVRRDPARPR